MITTPRAASLAVAAAFFALPAAADVSFTLTNSTSVDILEFYASPTSAPDWEDDILGSDILSAGEAATISIPEDRGCDYDIMAVFADGDELTDTLNICEISEYEFTEE